MAKPFFSVIIPTLNEEDYLPLLIQDLQSQQYKNFEVFIVDGKSDDSTPSLVRKVSALDSRFSLIETKKRNVSHQRNKGADAAQAQKLVFFDADSRIDADFLLSLKKKLSSDPSDSWTVFAQPDLETLSNKMFMSCQNYVFLFLNYVGLAFSVGACLGSTKTAFQKIGGFNEKTHFMEDVEFVQKIVKNKMIFRVYANPMFTLSMRRFEKTGKFNLMAKLVPHQLRALFKEEYTIPKHVYPMKGGRSYKSKQPIL